MDIYLGCLYLSDGKLTKRINLKKKNYTRQHEDNMTDNRMGKAQIQQIQSKSTKTARNTMNHSLHRGPLKTCFMPSYNPICKQESKICIIV